MRLLHVLRRDIRGHVLDYVTSAAMIAVAMVALVTRIDVQDADAYRFRPDAWWSWALTVTICATLVGRRRWPLRSFAVGLALALPLELAKHRDSVAFFALVIALFSVAANLPRVLAWRGVAMVVALYAVLIASRTIVLTAAPMIGPLLLATAFALGRLLRRSRLQQEQEIATAITRANEAAETAKLHAAAHRLRMAQELHDVVAHSLSVIAVQAGIGVHLIDRQPSEAALALDAIRTTSHTTEGELTRLVGILRNGSAAETGSAPTLSDLASLVEQMRTARVPIALTVVGDITNVPAGVSLAAYRIVQEALTNVIRHAGEANATVAVRTTADHLEIVVEDDGRGTTTAIDRASTDGGHGLIGMSERAEMYEGKVRSGTRPGGGFRVQATLRYFAGPIVSERAAGRVAAFADTPATAQRRRQVPTWVGDVALAIFLAALSTAEILASPATPSGAQYTPTDNWAWLLRIGCCLALVFRRSYPTLSYAAGWVLGLVLSIGNYQVGVVVFVLWIGVYSLAHYARHDRLVGGVLGTYLALVILALSKPPDLDSAGAVWLSLFLTASAVAGYVMRLDRERRASDLIAREDAADATSRRTQLVIATERIRIADELSTIIVRSITTISQRAGIGSHTVTTDPIAAGKTLQEISMISRDALNDLRRLLKHMRTESEPTMYAPIASTSQPVAAVSGDL
jgi:signal transduction histidine kinase